MKTSARKFIAQRRFANYGFFEQKPLKKIPEVAEVKVTITNSWLKNFAELINIPK